MFFFLLKYYEAFAVTWGVAIVAMMLVSLHAPQTQLILFERKIHEIFSPLRFFGTVQCDHQTFFITKAKMYN